MIATGFAQCCFCTRQNCQSSKESCWEPWVWVKKEATNKWMNEWPHYQLYKFRKCTFPKQITTNQPMNKRTVVVMEHFVQCHVRPLTTTSHSLLGLDYRFHYSFSRVGIRFRLWVVLTLCQNAIEESEICIWGSQHDISQSNNLFKNPPANGSSSVVHELICQGQIDCKHFWTRVCFKYAWLILRVP